jgi:hypothetical protein
MRLPKFTPRRNGRSEATISYELHVPEDLVDRAAELLGCSKAEALDKLLRLFEADVFAGLDRALIFQQFDGGQRKSLDTVHADDLDAYAPGGCYHAQGDQLLDEKRPRAHEHFALRRASFVRKEPHRGR